MTGRHYLDHASTSPIRAEALAAMNQWWAVGHGDPSRMHAEALAARYEIEQAREQVAAFFGARSREVVFTSGATESIAAAVRGASHRGTHQVLSAVEHSAVRLSAERLEAQNHRPTVARVNSTGQVDPDEMAAAVGPDTAAVHCQWANHEVGTVQPVVEVVAACRERSPDVLVHVDAAAAAGHVCIDFEETGADLMSISAHKLGGPPGIGALLVRRGLRLVTMLEGGDQERARRAGLENGAAIAGFAAACGVLQDGGLEQEADKARSQTDKLRDSAQSTAGVVEYGHPTQRLPHLVCLGISDVEPQAVLIALDRAGVAAHSGSSCASESLEPSPVLEAMGADAHHSLRLSVGWSTTDEDVEAAAQALPEALADLRRLGTGNSC